MVVDVALAVDEEHEYQNLCIISPKLSTPYSPPNADADTVAENIPFLSITSLLQKRGVLKKTK